MIYKHNRKCPDRKLLVAFFLLLTVRTKSRPLCSLFHNYKTGGEHVKPPSAFQNRFIFWHEVSTLCFYSNCIVIYETNDPAKVKDKSAFTMHCKITWKCEAEIPDKIEHNHCHNKTINPLWKYQRKSIKHHLIMISEEYKYNILFAR